MARLLVLGGGVCGLAGAMMLARDGHDVTVLERDPAPAPGGSLDAWEHWERNGVTQFRQPNYLQPAGSATLAAELPELLDALLSAGARRFELLGAMPPTIEDREPRAGDERFVTITARRPVLERVVALAAESEPGVVVRRGVAVRELLTRSLDGVPHVDGVRTDAGDELRADLVIDAMGRRSELPALLRRAGAEPPHEEAEDTGFLYYSRYFEGELPPLRAGLNTPVGTISLLTLPGDSGTWSVTIYGAAGDTPIKQLRHEASWMRVVAAMPLHAHWLDGEPLGGVVAMGGMLDRLRRMVVDGQPVATGVALLADACMCTNPSLGRGITLGLLHARRLREVVREHLGQSPRAFAEAWEADTTRELVPWYEATVGEDRGRLREIEALLAGGPRPAPESRAAELVGAVFNAARWDPDMFRAMLDLRCCLALPHDVLARPGVAERAVEVTAANPPGPVPGPDREQLLALVA